MVRKHHPIVQVILGLLTLFCAGMAITGTGLSAVISAIFVVALRVEANTGGMLVTAEEAAQPMFRRVDDRGNVL